LVCQVRAGLCQPAAPAPPPPGDKWHVDEVFIKITGITYYLWRAVDQHRNVLDILVQSRRNAVAAKRFFRKVRPERGRGLDVGRAG
jgi:transposase-like protein